MRAIPWTLMFCAPLAAQVQWQSVPPRFVGLPGNAATSMPVRWDQGFMQVLIEGTLLPGALQSTPIQRLRMRRSALDEPAALAGKTSWIEVRLGDTIARANQLTRNLVTNRTGATMTTVFQSRAVNIPAQAALSPGTLVGGDLIDLALDAPFSFAGPNLLLEWEAAAAAPGVSTGYWTDAVFTGPTDRGTWTQMGIHGCGSPAPRNVLLAAETFVPAFGQDIDLELSRAVPGRAGVLLLGVDPQNLPPFGLALGASLGFLGRPDCHLWATPHMQVPFTVDSLGKAQLNSPLLDLRQLCGQRVSGQAVILSGLQIETSNGVLMTTNRTGVGSAAVSLFAFGTGATNAGWDPVLGLTPVLLLGL